MEAFDMESQIRDQLDREMAATAPPPLGDLVAGAVATGRRHRRLRAFGGAAAGLAVVAVIGAAVALNGGGPARTNPGTIAPPQVPAASPMKPVTGQAVVAMLEAAVPAGGQFTEVDFGSDPAGVYGLFVYDDGHGKATVSGGVSSAPNDYGVTGFTCPAEGDGFHCEVRTLANGDVARILTMGPYGTDCADTKCSLADLRVELRRADGTYITAEAYSGPFGHGRGATRAATVLDTEQLIAVAQDPRWGLTMAAAFVDDAEANIHASS
jgi:hypothetical protein